MRRLLPLVLTLLFVAPAGCGGDDVDRIRNRAEQVRKDVERRIDKAKKDFEERRQRFGKRIDEIFRNLDKAFQQPKRTSPKVRSRGRNGPTTIDAFLTDILGSIDTFWTRTFQRNDLPAPRVTYDWVAPGGRQLTGCGAVADDNAAFYCPADDTIYVAQRFAADVYNGVARGLPGEQAGFGRAAGDFAVAYIVAHEYAHNIQQELGIFDSSRSTTATPYELHADCFAGVWAYSVYAEGSLQPGDIEEATNAALAVGDFDFGNAQHHGTPEERRKALLDGFDKGEPSACNQYLA